MDDLKRDSAVARRAEGGDDFPELPARRGKRMAAGLCPV